ncbi:MAG: hypothetical protein ACMG6E_03340, partial [Candidatus Roizmanbacteria bacterium]
VSSEGIVEPVLVPSNPLDLATAVATNNVIAKTAELYRDISPAEVASFLSDVPKLMELSKRGFPFTLRAPIPTMSSKDDHFATIRGSGIFDYPGLDI